MLQRGPRDVTLLGYTVQAAVDAETGVVVAADVAPRLADTQSVAPVLDQLEQTTGFRPVEMVCDAGYDSHAAHGVLAEHGVTGYVAVVHDDAGFWTDTGSGALLCPLGHPALPLRAKWYRNGWVQTYRVRRCGSCVFKPTCCGTGHGKQLESPLGVDPAHRIRAIRRARSPEGTEAQRHRLGSIERVFGDLKWNMRQDRMRRRGTAKVKSDILLALMVKNLKLMLKVARQADFGSLWVLLRSIWAHRVSLMPLPHPPHGGTLLATRA